MNKNLKLLCTAAVILFPAASFAGDKAVAVALGAAFMPVNFTTTTSWDVDDFDVDIPALNVSGNSYVDIFGNQIETGYVEGQTDPETVQVSGAQGSVTWESQEMRLTSISVAAAAGEHAAASATANAKGASAANSGASMRDVAVLEAKTKPEGSSFTSRVLVNQ